MENAMWSNNENGRIKLNNHKQYGQKEVQPKI